MRLKLSPHLKKAITESVSDLTISDAKVTRLTWDLASARILNTFLEVGVVSRDDLLKMIHQAIIAAGRECFAQHQNGQYPDHVLSPAALAYALSHNAFTNRERKKIKYDHGEDEAEFVALYDEPNFCGQILDQLLSLNPDDYSILGKTGSEQNSPCERC